MQKCFASKKNERLIPTRCTKFAEMASGKLGFLTMEIKRAICVSFRLI